jgi:dihydrofolate synthase / folylpolyglutamate synthase
MTLEEALRGLYARASLGMRLGLAPMREACARLGHPEAAFPVVHVAGTNGKGSVCAMVEAALRADGRTTGMYTSPHLCRFAERIRLNGEPIDDAHLARVVAIALTAGPELSFFEVATLAAFVAFRDANVDVGVIEVGIGGRLDATNVVPSPVASAITRIAFDHTDRLGPTLADIAREKAGIARPGGLLVLGPIEGEPLAVIEAEAARVGAILRRAPERDAETGLAGAHQKENANVAWALGEAAGVSAGAIARGLQQARWPGRLERIAHARGPYLLDAAHNPDGAAALARALAGERARCLVFGALADKPWQEMLDALAPLAERRVYVAPPVFAGLARAATDPAIFAARHAGETAASVPAAVERARELAGAEGLVVLCGSIFLIGEARALLLGLPRDPPIAL